MLRSTAVSNELPVLGNPEDLSEPIGRRLARVRKFRGLNQRELADKIPCSKSLIAQVESGHKPATQALIAGAARALHVGITEITGQPYRGTTARSDRIHATIPEIRRALVYWDVPPELETGVRPLSELRAETARATRLRQEAQYVELGEMLPALITELTATVHEASGRERGEAFTLLTTAYTAADSMAYKLGYLDLFHVALERVIWASGQADDALLPSTADLRRSMAFLSTGAYDGGLRLLRRTSDRLERRLTDDPGVLAVYGTTHLRAAIIAARGSKPSDAWAHMAEARETAARLDRDTDAYDLLFGPSNTAIHDVAVAVELGDADEAIRRGAGLELPVDLPAERSSHHYIDLGRAWLWTDKRERALESMLTAERLAPQRTRYHPMARETVTKLVETQRRIPDKLRGIARRMGVV